MKLRKKSIKTQQGKKTAVRVSKWFLPYYRTKSGAYRTTLQYITRSQCGVYIIRSRKTKEILYVGYSSGQLYKTLYRHFQKWDDKTQYRASYSQKSAYEVMVVLTMSCKLSYIIEQYYHKTLKPRDGIRRLELNWDEISKVRAIPSPKTNAIITKDEFSNLPQFDPKQVVPF